MDAGQPRSTTVDRLRPPQRPPDATTSRLPSSSRWWRGNPLHPALVGANRCTPKEILRIGETLGLHRSDLHFLPDSSMLGCRIKGAHVHVHRRLNPNGSLAKSRHSRHVPVTGAVTDAYSDYRREKDVLAPDSRSDFVFLNLYGKAPDTAMTYSNAKRCVDRLGRDAGVVARPHMLRHSAVTSFRNGERLDVVQDLLGHVSPLSTQVYVLPSESEKRLAVERVSAGNAVLS